MYSLSSSAGDIKRLELYIIGIDRRIEWRAREITHFPTTEILLPAADVGTGNNTTATMTKKRMRKPRPTKRKRKAWDDKLAKFIVDKTVAASIMPPLPNNYLAVSIQ